MKIAFDEFGSGESVVLLHAFPLSRSMWKPNIGSLVSCGYRVIVPDLRGFGESLPAEERFSIEEMADDIKVLLDFLEIEKTILCGLSMGGYIVFNLIERFPESVSAVILCDTTCSADTREKYSSRIKLIDQIAKDGTAVLVQQMLANLVCRNTIDNKTALYQSIEMEFLRCRTDSAAGALLAMADRRDSCGLLKRIRIPTLLIFGAEDQVTNLEEADKMRLGIKNSVLSILPDAGHYSSLENPEAFNTSVRQFLTGLENQQ